MSVRALLGGEESGFFVLTTWKPMRLKRKMCSFVLGESPIIGIHWPIWAMFCCVQFVDCFWICAGRRLFVVGWFTPIKIKHLIIMRCGKCENHVALLLRWNIPLPSEMASWVMWVSPRWSTWWVLQVSCREQLLFQEIPSSGAHNLLT